MTDAEIQRVQEALLRLRDQLLAAGDRPVAVAEDERAGGAIDEDVAPHQEMDQTIASSRNRERAARLGQVHEALRRLAETPDSFGECQECGEAIAPRRLELMPFARQCVQCQSACEGTLHTTRRKVTDYV